MNGLMRSRKKSKDNLTQKKVKNNDPKSMAPSKSSCMKEILSNTSLPRETRKRSNKQSNFTPK